MDIKGKVPTHVLPLSDNVVDRRMDPPMDPDEVTIRQFDPKAYGDDEEIIDFEIEDQIKNPGPLAKDAGSEWIKMLAEAFQTQSILDDMKKKTEGVK